MCAAYLISASYDKQIRFWDGASGRTVRCFSFQDSQVNALLLIPGTTYLAVAGFGVVRVYDIGATNTNCGSGGTGAGVQVPPLFSSYENQSAMNMTSLGSFLVHTVRGSGILSGSSREESSNSLFNATVEMTAVQGMSIDVGSAEVSTILYATSEDGHIRFFKAASSTSLCLVKDISTGAAITCSAVSPDRQTLLTGSQIGRVSLWHLPTIISVVTQRTENSRDVTFGDAPLQEIAFDTDYTAIRSIAFEPLARWAVVATNAGKLHFLRFMGGGTHHQVAPSAREEGNVGEDPSRSGETAVGPSMAEAALGETLDSAAGCSTRCMRRPNFLHSEGVYRSALVSSERNNSSSKGNALGSSLASHSKGAHAVVLSGSPEPNSRQASGQSPNETDAAQNATTLPPVEAESTLQQQFMMEVFHSFQAHYKYILKVAISPNMDLLVTCCADYTVGRFLIPPELQRSSVLRDEESGEMGTGDFDGNPALSRPAVPASEAAECPRPKSPFQGKPREEGVGVGTAAAAPSSTLLQPMQKETRQAPAMEQEKKQRRNSAEPKVLDLMNSEEPRAMMVSLGHPAGGEAKMGDNLGSNRRIETQDASSQLFSVIPSLSMEGNPQSHLSAVLQFKALKPLTGHMRWVWDCVFSDCGRFLFTASSDHHLRMWTGLLSDRVQSTCYVGHTKPVVCCILYYEKKR